MIRTHLQHIYGKLASTQGTSTYNMHDTSMHLYMDKWAHMHAITILFNWIYTNAHLWTNKPPFYSIIVKKNALPSLLLQRLLFLHIFSFLFFNYADHRVILPSGFRPKARWGLREGININGCFDSVQKLKDLSWFCIMHSPFIHSSIFLSSMTHSNILSLSLVSYFIPFNFLCSFRLYVMSVAFIHETHTYNYIIFLLVSPASV